MKLKRTLALFLFAIFPLTAAQATITIDTVPVGDVGNPGDATHSGDHGGVGYSYNIGKFEVTVGQYTAFLNAVAATDSYGLYNPSMATDLNIAGIAQSCSLNCTYSVIGSPDHPVTYVSWGDAARFANWLHNGQPNGVEDATTTEDGAYTLKGITDSASLMLVTRNADAKWFIPTQDEWYKAAYYQPTAQGGDSDGYWEYPMKTNSAPYSDQPPGATPDNTRVANFYRDDGSMNGYDDGFAVTGSPIGNHTDNYLTDVGAYTSSPSYYGTFDQGGNVGEWSETAFDGTTRFLPGGSWDDTSDPTSASHFSNTVNDPTHESPYYGFRVATIPEPGTLMLVGFAVVAGFGFFGRRT